MKNNTITKTTAIILSSLSLCASAYSQNDHKSDLKNALSVVAVDALSEAKEYTAVDTAITHTMNEICKDLTTLAESGKFPQFDGTKLPSFSRSKPGWTMNSLYLAKGTHSFYLPDKKRRNS